MAVINYTVKIYLCTCDKCGAQKEVTENITRGIYNNAQAVRSLGWSFGQKGDIKCNVCRQKNKHDRQRKKYAE